MSFKVISSYNEGDIIRSTATTSWIDRRLLGFTLPEADLDSVEDFINKQLASRDLLLGGTKYRFCNFLEGVVRVRNGIITDYGFSNYSDMYRSKSFPSTPNHQALGIPSQAFPIRRDCIATKDDVTFVQTVGCRTQSPEVIGGMVGCAVGGGVTPLVYPVGCNLGKRVGRKFAKELTAFPPIWTTLSLTIKLDGSTKQVLKAHSLFPSVSFYRLSGPDYVQVAYVQVSSPYDARTYIEQWKTGGWGHGNPWNIPSPKSWSDNHNGDIHPQAPAFHAGTGNFKNAGHMDTHQ
jgi:hypothetical protein